MRLSDEIVVLDDERYKDRNVLAELKYCGREIKHRKKVTNDDLRFMAWLCRSAADLLKLQIYQYSDLLDKPISVAWLEINRMVGIDPDGRKITPIYAIAIDVAHLEDGKMPMAVFFGDPTVRAIEKEKYGNTYRIWTRCPSEKERQAVKWE